jgi:membrane-associated phospholipid phosphatase
VAGFILIAAVLVAGFAFWRFPAASAVDNWGFSTVARAPHSSVLLGLSRLGSVPALACGSLLAALVAVTRDRRTALACLGGPVVAALLVEWVLKPMVGRRYLDVLSFPSGTVTVVSSLAAAWALAVPRWIRWPVIGIGTVVVVLAIVSVVGLRWHYPTDALAGALLGAGVVLVLDGVLHLVPGGG